VQAAQRQRVAAVSGTNRAGRGGLYLACIAAIVYLLPAAAPGDAEARGLATGFYAPREYYTSDTLLRNRWFDATVEANADLVRIGVPWNDVAGTQPPADPRNPSDPTYDFLPVDLAVRAAQERGLDVMLSVARAPPWAEGPNRPPEVAPGNWNPDPIAYGDFAHALAMRYSGTFPDPRGSGPLPRVSHFEAWGEPNLAAFFAPQWDGRKPTSPTLFRRLLNSFYAGIKSVHGDNLVIAPALAPYGDPPGGSRMRPLKFLRELFCLEGRKKPRPKKGCSKAELPRLDIFSHHPINLVGGPPASASHPDDATSGDLDRVKRVLRAAEKAGNIKPRGRRPLWITEFFWYSNPPTQGFDFARPLPVQARFLEQSLYVWWRDGAEVAINFLIRDNSDSVGLILGTGVFFEDGTPKPALDAFRFPFVADRRRKAKVLAWGKAPATGELEIQREEPEGWQTVKRLSVNDGAVFTAPLRIRGAAVLRAVVGSNVSLSWNLGG
jgi:hypothetical protein